MTTIAEMITFGGGAIDGEKPCLQKNVDLANSEKLYFLKNQLRGSKIVKGANIEPVTALPELMALDPDLVAKEKRKRRRSNHQA